MDIVAIFISHIMGLPSTQASLTPKLQEIAIPTNHIALICTPKLIPTTYY